MSGQFMRKHAKDWTLGCNPLESPYNMMQTSFQFDANTHYKMMSIYTTQTHPKVIQISSHNHQQS